ncbi:SRPBCC family protein [Phenylobacterium sp.]|uniref:SRPBCC family protein n=1 Tax=Phenylobacterium sp. TaxID=1871053 RepID=UPI00286BBEA0|nr:SRPBCC family protein [Phenylobacterium sp.]
MSRRIVTVVEVPATPEQVFARLDDQTRLAGHMERPSAMMGGGRMTYDFDAGRGQRVGSHIRMAGSAFGLSLAVDEVVTERNPPRQKVWRTAGATRLIILDAYSMGFDLEPIATGARLRVWIAYTLPKAGARRLLGRLMAPGYARWCVGRMARDAVDFFAKNRPGPRVVAAASPPHA